MIILETANIKIGGIELEHVKHFKYLGQVVNQERTNEQDIQIRLAKDKSTFLKMRKIFTAKKILISPLLRLVRCYVYTPMYNTDQKSLTHLKESVKRIEIFQM